MIISKRKARAIGLQVHFAIPNRHRQALHSDGAKLLESQLVNEKSSKDNSVSDHWTPSEKSAVNSNFPEVRLIARNSGTCNGRHH